VQARLHFGIRNFGALLSLDGWATLGANAEIVCEKHFSAICGAAEKTFVFDTAIRFRLFWEDSTSPFVFLGK
jgi:hypothetical protein